MPKYHYRCTSCLEEHSVRHSIKEKRENCEKCKSEGTLVRVPFAPFVLKRGAAGKIVKKHIEETRQEISREKEEMQKEYDT